MADNKKIDLKPDGKKQDPAPRPKPVRRKVIVHRHGVEQENSDLVISVNTCDERTGGKKEFLPGQEVSLTETQIEILNNAVIEHDFELEGDSAVYSSDNPLQTARNNFPEFRCEVNRVTGAIRVHKRTPMYIVQPL